MKNKLLIDETLKGVIYIGNKTYENFLDSFNVSTESFGALINLECEIFALQCFNLLYGGDIGLFTRKKLNKKCYKNWISRYGQKLANEHLEKALEYRLKESYLPIFKKARVSGNDSLMQDLHNHLIVVLKNSESSNILSAECPPIPVDAFLKVKFLELEAFNFRVVATISKIFQDDIRDNLKDALVLIEQSTNR